MNEAISKNEENLTDDIHALDWDRLPPYVRQGIEALKDKHIEGLRVYDLRGFTPFCDFVIIGTAMSPAQSIVARQTVINAFAENGLKVYGIEGDENSNWLLIDFWDVVVHIFRPDTRKYYNLEALWADLPWWPGEIQV